MISIHDFMLYNESPYIEQYPHLISILEVDPSVLNANLYGEDWWLEMHHWQLVRSQKQELASSFNEYLRSKKQE